MDDQTTIQTQQPNGADWRTSLPTDLQSIPSVKEAPDLPSFVKRFNDQEREIGKARSEYQAFRQSVEQAGKLALDSPDKYTVNLDPEIVPAALRDEALISEFKQIAHSTRMTQEQANAVAGLYQKIFQTTKPLLEYDQAQSEIEVKKLAEKNGVDYESVKTMAANGLKELLAKRPGAMDKLEAAGLTNDPDVLWAFYEMGLAHSESLGLTGTMTDANRSAVDEATDITRNKSNPKHELYWKNDKHTVDYVNSLWAKAYPGKVNG